MGCFAVLKPDGASAFAVDRCHVNLWSLPGLLGHRPMIVDVGLLIRLPDEADQKLDQVAVAIPGALDPGVEDLARRMRRLDVAKLVFGNGLAPGTGDDKLMLYERDRRTGAPLRDRAPVAARLLALQGASALDDSRSEPNVSVAMLKLADPLKAGEVGYIRARFAYHRPGRMLVWKRVLRRRDSALVDFRIADPREAATVKDGDRLEAEMKTVVLENVDVFVMAPDAFHLTEANPALTYSRLLEGAAWTPYIGGLRGSYGESKLVVHHWHATDVGVQRPFRGFLALRRRPAFAAPSDALMTALLAVLLAFGILAPLKVRHGLQAVVDNVFDTVGGLVLAAVGVLSVGLVITLLQRRRAWVRGAKRWLKARERGLLGLRDPRA